MSVSVCSYIFTLHLRPTYVPVRLKISELSELLKELRPHWETLANKLYIPIAVQEEIAEQLTVSKCHTKMLTAWIKNSDNATFQKLIEAIESGTVAHRALAISISQDAEVLKLLKVPESDKG